MPFDTPAAQDNVVHAGAVKALGQKAAAGAVEDLLALGGVGFIDRDGKGGLRQFSLLDICQGSCTERFGLDIVLISAK